MSERSEQTSQQTSKWPSTITSRFMVVLDYSEMETKMEQKKKKAKNRGEF